MSLHLTENRPLLWTVRILSLAALAVSLTLLAMKFTGRITSLSGCGGEGG